MTEVTDNAGLSRYEMVVDGIPAFVTYIRQGDRLMLVQTEVPKKLGGCGIGSLLAAACSKTFAVAARVSCRNASSSRRSSNIVQNSLIWRSRRTTSAECHGKYDLNAGHRRGRHSAG
jgi:hypothetical protein